MIDLTGPDSKEVTELRYVGWAPQGSALVSLAALASSRGLAWKPCKVSLRRRSVAANTAGNSFQSLGKRSSEAFPRKFILFFDGDCSQDVSKDVFLGAGVSSRRRLP